MGLPSWAYSEQASLSEWEDRGAYLYNRRTGEKRPKGAAGGLTNLTKPSELSPEELQRRLDAWKAENDAARARGERDGQPWNSRDPFADFVKRGFGTGASPEVFRERLEAATRGMGDENLENRTGEVTLPHWIDKVMMEYAPKDRYGRDRTGPGWLPRVVIPYAMSEGSARRRRLRESATAGPPQGLPRGSGDTYDPRWLNPDGSIREDAPEEVHRGIDESVEWSELRSEREDDPEEGYEATRSPLVLRKRNFNGTVTYVHALTGQPLFDLGEYGLNDPQADDFEGQDPYWRASRREW